MDKTIEQILQDQGMSEIPFNENITMFYPALFEAMKIAMKQAYEAGERAGFDDCRYAGHPDIQPEHYSDFYEWFNKLEEKK